MCLSWLTTRLTRSVEHCFIVHAFWEGTPGVNAGGGSCEERRNAGVRLEEDQKGDIRSQLKVEKQGWHSYFLTCTFSWVISSPFKAPGVIYMEWFPCLYIQPWRLHSPCLHLTACENIHQITHSSTCLKIKSSSQNLHIFLTEKIAFDLDFLLALTHIPLVHYSLLYLLNIHI